MMVNLRVFVVSSIVAISSLAHAYDLPQNWQALVKCCATLNSSIHKQLSSYGQTVYVKTGISKQDVKQAATVAEATGWAAGIGAGLVHGVLRAGRVLSHEATRQQPKSRSAGMTMTRALGKGLGAGFVRAGLTGLMAASVPLGLARVLEKTA